MSEPLYEELENFVALQMSEQGCDNPCFCYSCTAGDDLLRRGIGATAFVVHNPDPDVLVRYQLSVFEEDEPINCVEVRRRCDDGVAFGSFYGFAVRIYEGGDELLVGNPSPMIQALLDIALHELASTMTVM